MHEWINGFLSLPWLPLSLGIVIALLTIVDAFLANKKPSELVLKVAVVVLAIVLLFAQWIGGKASSKKVAADLKIALDSQRELMTQTFKTGTDQIIKAATESADKTLKASRKQYQSTIDGMNGVLKSKT